MVGVVFLPAHVCDVKIKAVDELQNGQLGARYVRQVEFQQNRSAGVILV